MATGKQQNNFILKKTLFILLFTMFFLKGFTQQNPLYTQFMFNPYVINPAITGTHTYYQIWSNHRIQWIGMPESPLTNTLSIYGPLENQDMGVGGFVYSDVTGPSSRLGINGSYAYNFAISDEYRLSFGLMLGVIQYKIDYSNINYYDPVSNTGASIDPVFMGTAFTKWLPDASIGAYFYSSNMYAGLASTTLLANEIDPYTTIDSEENPDIADSARVAGRLARHYYLSGGYKYFINREFALEPAITIKGASPSPPQVDFNVRVIYDNMAWAGISYRSQDAISVLGGYTYENKIFVGLSYDIGINKLAGLHSGSIEFIVGYKFNSIKD